MKYVMLPPLMIRYAEKQVWSNVSVCNPFVMSLCGDVKEDGPEMDIKIIVAAHKPYWMPEDDIYLPLQVGKAGKSDIGYQGDDSGENIREKNLFC